MLSDLDIANLLQAQYDGLSTFDYQNRIGAISVALKYYPDCTAVLFEGSHNIPDWFSNFEFIGIPVSGLGLIEQGFYDDMPTALETLKPYLQPDKPIHIGGHSRGAAHCNVYARMLIASGYLPSMIRRTKFGEPHSMSAKCAEGFAGSPTTSYRNYGDPLDQDFVCTVPFYPLVASEAPTLVDAPGPPDDPWLLLKRHHLFLYTKALQNE